MLFFKVQLHIATKLPDEKIDSSNFLPSKFHFPTLEHSLEVSYNRAPVTQLSNSETAKRNTQISANLLENFRRAGTECLWVLIIYEAKRCLFCLTIFGLLSLSSRSTVSSLLLTTNEKIGKFKMCAQFSPVKFRNVFAELTFIGFLETRAECGLEIGDILDGFFDDFDLKESRTIDLPFGIFLR